MRFKANFFLVFLLFLPFISKAQWNTGGDIDATLIHFGFQLGYNTNTFQVDKVKNYQTIGKLNSVGLAATVSSGRLQYIQALYTSGFHLGLLANMRLTDNLDLRFSPDVNFADRRLAYGYDSLNTDGNTAYSNPIVKTVSSTYLDFPLLLKFKSDRKRNIRAYIIGGIVYSYDIIPKKKVDDAGLDEVDKLVKVQNNLLSYKVGLGLDLYYEFFKMSPEITISNALTNSVTHDGSTFANPISRLFPNSIQLTLYFE